MDARGSNTMYFGEKSKSVQEDTPSDVSRMRRIKHKTVIVLRLSSLLCLASIATLLWFLFIRKPAAATDPFTPQVSSSVQFPLYYPTYVPSGFHVNPKSVSEPQTGVIVFNLVNQRGAKLFVSEEARPSTFDLGGFYNSLVRLHEIGVADGAVAVGWLHNSSTEVGSRANNKTWVLINTTVAIPQAELIRTLESLSVAAN